MEDKNWKQILLSVFDEVFGEHEGTSVFFAPGRVNLIGEHTDYNGGHVFPCALTLGTYVAARKNNCKQIRVYSKNYPQAGIKTTPLDQIHFDQEQLFANYPFGVIAQLLKEGYPITSGIDLCMYGNLISCSGLSSSASVEVVTAFAVRELFQLDISLITIAQIAKRAENDFVGVNCGIMDQFAIAMGKRDHAIYLDTDSMKYQYAPLVIKDTVLLIACTNKQRGLSDSKYNERRRECEEALQRINQVSKRMSFGRITEDELKSYKDIIKDEILYRRARHAVTENIRTKRAYEALCTNDLTTFGLLMIQSHKSLRDDYEVTGTELDTLVDAALSQPGVLGSRMTGAGFGGCTISIVRKDCVDDVIMQMQRIYQSKIGYAADFFDVMAGCGPYQL